MCFFLPKLRKGAVRLNFRVARLKPEPELLVVDVLVAPTLA